MDTAPHPLLISFMEWTCTALPFSFQVFISSHNVLSPFTIVYDRNQLYDSIWNRYNGSESVVYYAIYGRKFLNLWINICYITIYCNKYTRAFSKSRPGCSARDYNLQVQLFTNGCARSHKTTPEI
jgi:hypothetical protein